MVGGRVEDDLMRQHTAVNGCKVSGLRAPPVSNGIFALGKRWAGVGEWFVPDPPLSTFTSPSRKISFQEPLATSIMPTSGAKGVDPSLPPQHG
ncbi:hypothetical protein ACJZ2D_011870 [Fusarium nematophilum]